MGARFFRSSKAKGTYEKSHEEINKMTPDLLDSDSKPVDLPDEGANLVLEGQKENTESEKQRHGEDKDKQDKQQDKQPQDKQPQKP